MQKAVSDQGPKSPPNRAGARAFRWSRVTSVALLVLVPYALFLALGLAGSDLATVRAALASSVNAVALAALILAGVWHMWLGMTEIIEDYIRGPALRTALTANTLFSLLVGIACLAAIVRLMLGA